MGRDLAARTRQTAAQRGARQDGEGQVEQNDDAVKTMAHFINGLRGQMARALPKHMDADRMARHAMTVLRRNTKLAACSTESFAGALLTASALGLEPGVNDECYLVPYKMFDKEQRRAWVECQLIIGYQGYSKQFYQHPLALDLTAHAVYEADEFDWQYGTSAFLHHKPSRLPDRGEVIDYYALARLTSGATPFVVLSPEEVKVLRRGKVGASGDIPDPQRWMERKTVVRQLAKLLPKSTGFIAAIAADERDGSDLLRERVVERSNAEVIDLAPSDFSEAQGEPPADEKRDAGQTATES